ncbi:MAG: hypothetical protein D6737_04260 [Chloroflexi bacterium]|nr:MAG: hypothetical protein D6737_04260 [Chloroflexota bacterium]
MFDNLPLVIVVCVFSLVCIGTLAIGAYLLLGLSPTALMERFAGVSDDEIPDEGGRRRRRRKRGTLRAQAQSLDFDDALNRKLGDNTPNVGAQSAATNRQHPRLRRRGSLVPDDSDSDRILRRRRDEVDPDEVRDILDDEGEDFL